MHIKSRWSMADGKERTVAMFTYSFALLERARAELERARGDRKGVTALEYGLIAAAMAAVLATVFGKLTTGLSTLFGDIAGKLTGG